MAMDSTPPNLEQLLQLGIQTAREGNKASARVIFQQILDADKQNERAWLWMASVAETPADHLRYLKTVLRINPNNQAALRELDKMKRKKESSNTQVMRYGIVGVALLLILIVFAVLVLIIL